MELLSKLVELALVECYERAVIDWLPEDGAPESFVACCEIEQNPFAGRDWYIYLNNVFIIVDVARMEAWHSSILEGYCVPM